MVPVIKNIKQAQVRNLTANPTDLGLGQGVGKEGGARGALQNLNQGVRKNIAKYSKT